MSGPRGPIGPTYFEGVEARPEFGDGDHAKYQAREEIHAAALATSRVATESSPNPEDFSS